MDAVMRQIYAEEGKVYKGYERFGNVYRDVAYVTEQVTQLATQLKAVEDATNAATS